MERIRGKDLFIEAQTTEMKQLRSTVQSQESSISYFKKKNEDFSHEIEQLQIEKQQAALMPTFLQAQNVQLQKGGTVAAEPAPQVNSYDQIRQQLESLESDNQRLEQALESAKPQQDIQGEDDQEKEAEVDLKDIQITQLTDDNAHLKTELDKVTQDLLDEQTQRRALAEKVTGLEQLRYDLLEKVALADIKESKSETQNLESLKTIKELERRREMARKEIKQLYVKLKNGEKQMEEQQQTIQQMRQENTCSETPNSQSESTELTLMASGQKDLHVAGLVQLRIFQSELGKFYKELLPVVFSEPIDVEAARALERRVNDLVLTVSDSINEVELQVM